jgi:N-sulfoglucosamine sulfohydrolase
MQDTPQVKEDFAKFQGVIKYFDECVGKILDCLENSNISDNALIIMSSDHGIPYPGAKWTVRKAGINIPLIMYQPDTVFSQGKVFNSVMSNVDFLPTLLDYLNVKIPSAIQGYSFMDYINGKTANEPRTSAFAQYTPEMKRDNISRSVITKNYHLIRYFDAGRKVNYPVDVHPQAFADHTVRCPVDGTRPFAQLYDIINDPYELHDIAGQTANESVVQQLSGQLLDWMKQVNDPLLKGPLPTPYYEQSVKDLYSCAE